MAGEALRCSYVVLSVGRYLDPALAVRNLNPELPPPHTKSGVFFARNLPFGGEQARAPGGQCSALIQRACLPVPSSPPARGKPLPAPGAWVPRTAGW